MRRLLLLCIAVLLCAFTASAQEKSLVLIRAGEDHGPALDSAGWPLIASLPDGYLALLEDEDVARLAASGLDHAVVSSDDLRYEYFVLYDVPAGHRETSLPDAAEVVFEARGYRVVRAPAAEQLALSCLPDVQRVLRRPLRFPGTAWLEPAARDVADPMITAIVAAVQQADLEADVLTLQNFVTRHSQYAGGAQASYWIRDEFLSFGYTDVTLHDYNSWNDNVVCIKPGSADPDKIVVIGGHYDSLNGSNPADSPGADDNATGTACVLACARHFAPYEFEYTIVFIAFSGEEQGLYGSDAWASQAAAAGKDIVGMICLDMLGYRASGDARDIDIIANTASQPLRQLVDQAVALYVPAHVAVTGSLPFGASSDHASFWDNGYRAILFFEDTGSYSPYIHTANDRVGISVNDYPFMTDNVRVALATTAMLARPFTISITPEPLAHQAGPGPFEVTAQVAAAGEVDPGSVLLHHRIDGGAFVDAPMAPTGTPGEYAVEIPATGTGHLVEYYLTASDTEAHTAASPDGAPATLHAFRTGVALVFADDAETDRGWSFSAAGDNAISGLWLRADPVGTDYQPEDDHTAEPGHICFVTGNGVVGGTNGAQDVDGGRTTLVSPIIDLAGSTWVELSYWRYYVDETSHDDDFRVDISDDGGASWTSLEVVGDTAIPWTRAVFELPIAGVDLTSQMRLRFIAEDVNDGSLVEAAIDDVSIMAVNGLTGVDDDVADGGWTGGVAAPHVASLAASPNPFNPMTELRYVLPRAGDVRVRVYDARGREVARLAVGPRPAGAGSVTWNARGVATGMYLARLEIDGIDIAASKLMLLR